METRQRYFYAGALLLLFAALLWGGFSLEHLLPAQQAAHQRATAARQVARTVLQQAPTPNVALSPTATAHAEAKTTHTSRHIVKEQSEPSASSATAAQTSLTKALARLTRQDGSNGSLDSMDGARLIIPAIGLNAPIQSLGVTSTGGLAVPTTDPWTSVGWYKDGPWPGDTGSAIIDGHLDRPGGYPAVFWYLRDLHPGDKVIVQDTDGNSVSFHVTSLQYYTRTAPTSAIFGNTSGSFLNLITCAGTWIPAIHQTTMRLVVYTAMD